MSRTKIPPNIKCLLWGRAGGRCQYDGCNTPLFRDSLTQLSANNAYVCHIVADSPDGPRGDPIRSELLKTDLNNLMLLCNDHHRIIDHEALAAHPEARLIAMKRAHEARLEIATGVTPEKQSHIVLYGANIGDHAAALGFERVAGAMAPAWFPAEARGIELGTRNNSATDRDVEFWQQEARHLRRQFRAQVRPRLQEGGAPHLSVFALAPQPLLVLLGSLLSDIPAVEVYQLRREPTPDWRWADDEYKRFVIARPSRPASPKVALVLSLSARIDDDRISAVLGPDVATYHVSVPSPHNDVLRSRAQLEAFRQLMRPLLDELKPPGGDPVHVFLAAPVSICVELGRVHQPRAHPPLRVYEQNVALGGFVHALDVGQQLEEP